MSRPQVRHTPGPWLGFVDGEPAIILHDEAALESFWRKSEVNDNVGSVVSLAQAAAAPALAEALRDCLGSLEYAVKVLEAPEESAMRGNILAARAVLDSLGSGGAK